MMISEARVTPRLSQLATWGVPSKLNNESFRCAEMDSLFNSSLRHLCVTVCRRIHYFNSSLRHLCVTMCSEDTTSVHVHHSWKLQTQLPLQLFW